MKAIERLSSLLPSRRAAAEIEVDAADYPPASDEQLSELEKLCTGNIPNDVRTFLQSTNNFVFVPGADFLFDTHIELVGVDHVMFANRDLAASRDTYDFYSSIEPCVALCLVNGEYLACRLRDSAMLRIDSSDGSVDELGVNFVGFLDAYADTVESLPG